MHVFYLLTCVLFIIAPFSKSAAQCSDVTPPYTSCAGLSTNAIQLTSGMHLSSGKVYYYNGGPATINIGSYNGGTIVVCGGPLTINGINIAGTVIVTQGSSLIINGSSNLQNQGKIYNDGNLRVNGSMHVNRDGIYNNGVMTVTGEIRFNGGGRMCIGNGAALSAGNVYNDQANAITISSGVACVSYTGSFGGNNPITNTSSLYICRAPGASAPTGSSVGNGNLMTNCTSCAFPLAVDLLSFSVAQTEEYITLKWITANEQSISHFNVEFAGADGQFKLLETVDAKGIGNVQTEYSFQDKNPRNGVMYYRLSEVNFSGEVTELAVRTISINNSDRFVVYPNPTTEGHSTKINYQPKTNDSTIEIYSSVGMLVTTIELSTHTNSYEVNLPVGQYIVRLIEDGISSQIKPLVVL